MISRFLLAIGLVVASYGIVASSDALAGDRHFYADLHAHEGACGGSFLTAYDVRRPHYYQLDVKVGRYVWRKRRVLVRDGGHRSGRLVYRTVRKRVLVRPVRYRVHKRYGAKRAVGHAIVAKGHRGHYGRRTC